MKRREALCIIGATPALLAMAPEQSQPLAEYQMFEKACDELLAGKTRYVVGYGTCRGWEYFEVRLWVKFPRSGVLGGIFDQRFELKIYEGLPYEQILEHLRATLECNVDLKTMTKKPRDIIIGRGNGFGPIEEISAGEFQYET